MLCALVVAEEAPADDGDTFFTKEVAPISRFCRSKDQYFLQKFPQKQVELSSPTANYQFD
jgi:hypothetical protein